MSYLPTHDPALSKFRTARPKSMGATAISLSVLSLLSLSHSPAVCGESESNAKADSEADAAPSKKKADSNSAKSETGKTKSGDKLIATMQPNSSDSDEDAKNKDNAGKDATTKESTGKNEAQSYFEQERSNRKRKYAHSSSTVQIYAPQAVVWKVLIDFERYPQIFKRIDTCHITKREHGLLYAETYLKPQMFVKKLVQHTVTDTTQGPHYLQWKMLDGNFKSVVGSWTLSSTNDKKGKPVCQAEYTLEADPGPVIPGALVSFMLHQIEHEVVTAFKKSCEQTYAEQGDKQSNAPTSPNGGSPKIGAAKVPAKG